MRRLEVQKDGGTKFFTEPAACAISRRRGKDWSISSVKAGVRQQVMATSAPSSVSIMYSREMVSGSACMGFTSAMLAKKDMSPAENKLSASIFSSARPTLYLFMTYPPRF